MSQVLFIYIIGLFFLQPLPENQDGVKFLSGQDYTFEQIQEIAQKENKLIFVDFWASWCGPCRQMERDVFSDALVADRFNSSFINYKVDVDQSPGKEMRHKYRIYSLPTTVFFKPDGELIVRLEGMTTVKFLLEDADSAVSDSK
jgi:thiol:disulfide interchange protein